MTRPNPVLAGLVGQCPQCGEGQLFSGFLTVSPQCEACGLDLGAADPGDGASVFVILVVGLVIAFSMLFTEFTFHPPVWMHLVIWMPLTVLLCLGLMRPFKGVLLALQFHNRAAQARNDD
jgi:uncharacterized protein (DUF983 family)